MTTFLKFDDFDRDVLVQDDLYRHVNGAWLERTQIPDDKPTWGAFVQLHENSQEAVREIITSLEPDEPGSNARKIADLFASFMDEARAEELGAAPLAPLLDRIAAVASARDLATTMGWLMRRGIGGPIGIDTEADPGNPREHALFIDQAGIGLPDEAYYRADEHAEVRTAYRAHVEAMFRLLGQDDAADQADLVFTLETEIAAGHWDNVRTRDLVAMYNPMSIEDLTSSAPGLDWGALFAGLELEPPASVINAQPPAVTHIASLISDDRLPSWQAWCRWRVLSAMAPMLSADFVAERFGFAGTVLTGTPVQRPRWKRGVDLVEGALGEAVGQLYVERHFSTTAKARMDELVANLIEAYRQSITALGWMTEPTKQAALDKLSKFTPKIGYPDKWRDYSALEIVADDLVGNVVRCAEFDTDWSLRKVGTPVDPDEWLMTPQTVNAYYHPLRNEIVFPAAILQPPLFSEDADDAVNYGAIGAVIGHEIGHGFDDQGSTCDGDGVLRDWWTDADRAAFTERTSALVEQYNALSPAEAPDLHVNGALTIGENIGDLGGLGIAIKAWQLAAGGDVDPIDGFTGLQRLFLSWATVWQQKSRPEVVRQMLAIDPHSPPEFRCNQIVRNIDDFYAAFDVKPDDALWLDAGARVTIW